MEQITVPLELLALLLAGYVPVFGTLTWLISRLLGAFERNTQAFVQFTSAHDNLSDRTKQILDKLERSK